MALVFHGNISLEVMTACEELVKKNVYPMLVSVPLLVPLQSDALLDVLKNVKTVVSVEEHYENCGLGSILRKIYQQYKPSWDLKVMGMPCRFIHEVKNTAGMRRHFCISSQDIMNVVDNILHSRRQVDTVGRRIKSPSYVKQDF